MVDDARTRLQEILERVGAKAVGRLHELHPHLRGRSPKDTVAILKIEERLKKWGSQPPPQSRGSLFTD
jgi:hypothetical protein